ncbi:MAG: alanine:cation symporter family protein [Candidatus Sumerlaeia bacterium]|nr:alanine:cation symporter family protein [Candidatus Sumerlaeia bacterium]
MKHFRSPHSCRSACLPHPDLSRTSRTSFLAAALALALVLALFARVPADSAPEIVDDVAVALQQTADQQAPAPAGETRIQTVVNRWVEGASNAIFGVLFFDVSGGSFRSTVIDRDSRLPVLDESGNPKTATQALPLLIVVLLFGGIFFTIYYRFVNIRGFRHSIDVVRGRFDKAEDEGEVSHFRALTSALSATVGLGNIAGVAIAVSLGGPGAVFWMLVTAFFGMASKFSCCTLGQMYRQVNADGTISGGPMYYLDRGLAERGGFFKPLGKVLAIAAAIMVMGAAVGGGNLFQANQSYAIVEYVFDLKYQHASAIYGVIAALLVGAVIIGGIKRIGAATSRIVPLMAGVYILGCLVVILSHADKVPGALALIVREAFAADALYGGFIGVLVMGVRRAAFSNEAGIGSAAIAHSAARTNEPVREGIVGLLEPFIDTIVICMMTAIVVIVTGVYDIHGAEKAAIMATAHHAPEGAVLTAVAFGQVVSWFPYILAAAVVLFAYSTMISWCYYGERGWIYLFDHWGGIGLRSVILYRLFFVFCVFVGAVANLGPIIDLSDALLLSMAFPNILGMILLAPLVKKKTDDYFARLRAGKMPVVR